MKAAVYHGRGDVRVEERLEPQVRAGTLKVKVDWCGICGTDLHEYEEGPIFVPAPGSPHPITGETLPLILGHEFAGTITELGPEVSGFKVGQRVAIDPILASDDDDECRRGDLHPCRKPGFQGLSGAGGGFSSFVVARAERTHDLGDLGTDIGAMVEPLAVAFHAVRESGIRPGDTAVVYGAGPIGQAAVLCLRAAGAGTVIVVDPAAARQEMARQLKADLVYRSARDRRGGRGAAVDAGPRRRGGLRLRRRRCDGDLGNGHGPPRRHHRHGRDLGPSGQGRHAGTRPARDPARRHHSLHRRFPARDQPAARRQHRSHA